MGEGGERQAFFDGLAQGWDARAAPEMARRLAGLVARMGVVPGARVLDVGTGTGAMVEHLWEALGGRGRIIALDISLPMLRQAQRKVLPARFLQANALALPFVADYFDYAIYNAIFPHLPDKARVLGEAYRVLAPGGTLAISHALGRQGVNMRHREMGGAVGQDMLPEEAPMRRLLEGTGFVEVRIGDGPEGYLALACKG